MTAPKGVTVMIHSNELGRFDSKTSVAEVTKRLLDGQSQDIFLELFLFEILSFNDMPISASFRFK